VRTDISISLHGMRVVQLALAGIKRAQNITTGAAREIQLDAPFVF
jgi:hypothetical protein